MTRDEIVAEARRYVALKSPWRHRGRAETGVDCLGLICIVATALGVPYQDVGDYSRFPDGRLMIEMKRQLVLRQPPLLPGQVVVLRESVTPCHVGFIAERFGNLTLIHATLDRRRVVEEEYNQDWHHRFRAVFDLPGVED